jgi:DNA-binding protein H-NS
MSTLQELLDQRAAIEREIESTRRREKSDAIAKIRALMSEHGLSVADLSGKAVAPKASSTAGSKVAAKYRNAATGETWSGRGLQPKWLKAALAAGRSIEEFSV